MMKNTSPSNRKKIRIQYVEKLTAELERVEGSFESLSCSIPDEISETKINLEELLEFIEDSKPNKDQTRIKSKMLESESKINKLSTELKDIQFKGIGSSILQSRIKEIEIELQHHRDRVQQLKQQLSQPVINSVTNASQMSKEEKDKLSQQMQRLKSNSKLISDSVGKMYKMFQEFISQGGVASYFNMISEVMSKIPELRGGLDIGGVINIGGDEQVETLERMNDYIQQSSRWIFELLQELPSTDRQWLKKNKDIYTKTLENIAKQQEKLQVSDNLKDIIIKPHKFIQDIFKKKNRSPPVVNLLEKITIREKDNNQSKLDQEQQQNKQERKIQKRKEKPQYTQEPFSSIQTQIDAIIADMNNFMKFPDTDILVNLLTPMESKSKMLITLLDQYQSRFSFYQEKLQVWIDYNSTILRVTYYESDSSNFKFKDFKSLQEIQSKLKILLKVLHVHMTSCPIAIPMIYLNEGSWKLTSYPDFRAHQRKELEKLLLVVKSNQNPIDTDTVRKCTLELTDVLIAILNVQIPLMIEVFQDDSTLFKTKNWSSERKSMLTTINDTIHSLKYLSTTSSQTLIDLLNTSVKMIQSIMLQCFTYKPIARPTVYKSDQEWKLLSESRLRYEYRTSILI
ncbi:hypothetical protein DLAC_06845 [Tieghemostelium lacteum]|uniref:Integrase catalytic domain-containing protein n=1 Tax=Tieghemostelium lacteum TaxID=361077 RepID=A0A151ZDM0_TIELA|nr:hypothetical protein DLAC_06845 [Tieghemostelium lacteum]|eukprot:KYQ92019.1 hypothetical protein DLAC_06845 [Tieghemostelium lacteum]